MTSLYVHETSIEWEVDVSTDEQECALGTKLHQLDALIDFICYHHDQHEQWSFDTLAYAHSLICSTTDCEWPFETFPEMDAVQDMYADTATTSDWPFGNFPEVPAVQDMYFHWGMDVVQCFYPTRGIRTTGGIIKEHGSTVYQPYVAVNAIDLFWIRGPGAEPMQPTNWLDRYANK